VLVMAVIARAVLGVAVLALADLVESIALPTV
jgi:hypothetical protein